MTMKRTPTLKRSPLRRARVEAPPLELETVTCGFCDGRSRDPFGIMSSLSRCCVCGGKGIVFMAKPHVRCAFCEGTGVYPSSRLTCTACGGVGDTPVAAPNRQCPHCRGTGAEPGGELHLWCLACRGAGVVQAKE